MVSNKERPDALITETTLVEFFRDSVDEALVNQQVDAEPDTVYYLVNLLSFFSRSERLFERSPDGVSLKPLALMYAEALGEESVEGRYRLLRRLGDVSLFISGVFPQSLSRKVVDLDYYMAMGGGAYAALSSYLRDTVLEASLCEIFAELAEKFTDFADVLAEVSERNYLAAQADLLRLYETWLRTGSRRAYSRLAASGITPSEAVVSRREH